MKAQGIGTADHHQPHLGARRSARRSARRHAPCRGNRCPPRWREADIVITATGARAPIITRGDGRGGHAAAAEPAALHHRHRRAARRGGGGRRSSSRCFSTTSTICRRWCRRISRGAPPKSSRPKPSWPTKSREFGAWQRSRGAVPTVVALRQRFEAIRRVGAASAWSRKLSGLRPEARARVDEVTRLIVEKLLLDAHRTAQGAAGTPTRSRRIREALNRLFDLSARRPRTGRATTESARLQRAVRAPDAPQAERVSVTRSALARAAASSRSSRRRLVAQRILEAERPLIGDRRHQDVGRSAAGRAAVGDRRQAAVRQGNRGRAARAARSTSRCTAARTCRRCCRTAWRSRPCCRAKIRATRSCCREEAPRRLLDEVRSRRSGTGADASAPAACGASRSSSRLFPGARFEPIRGNLDTRLRKLDAGDYDALVLAAAGLRRLGFESRISVRAAGRGLRAGAGPGHHRDRDPRGRSTQSSRPWRAINDADARVGARRRARAGDGARRRLPDAHRRRGAPSRATDLELARRGDRRSTAPRSIAMQDGGARRDAAALGGAALARTAAGARAPRRYPDRARQKLSRLSSSRSSRMMRPVVYLIGTGPGDPGLITVRGLRLPRARADVVLYDHLVPPRLLRYARPDAEMIDVGAAAPQPLAQEAISYLLAGKSARRQDRGAAEMGRPVRVRSRRRGSAVPARAGRALRGRARHPARASACPATPASRSRIRAAATRSRSSAATKTRAHTAADDRLGAAWRSSKARSSATPARSSCRECSRRCSARLVRGDEPAALVYNGTLPTQETDRRHAGASSRDMRSSRSAAPAILVVGRVVGSPRSPALVRRAAAVRQARARHPAARSGRGARRAARGARRRGDRSADDPHRAAGRLGPLDRARARDAERLRLDRVHQRQRRRRVHAGCSQAAADVCAL